MGNSNSINGEFISGIIGVTLLKKNDKYVIVFSDSHSNVEYCKNSGVKISSWVSENLEKDKIDFILEEVPRSKFIDLEEIWASEHFKDLKELFLSNKKVKGFDIRPYLIPFSIENVFISDQAKEFTVKEYLNNMLNFFNYNNKHCIEVFNNLIKNKTEKKTGIKEHFYKMKNDFFNFYKNLNLNRKLKDMLNNNDFFDKVELFSNRIIEWYSIINVYSSKKTSVIHTGLYHSINIVQNLNKIYNFDIIWEKGHTREIPDINDDQKLYSCVFVPKKVIDESINNNFKGGSNNFYF